MLKFNQDLEKALKHFYLDIDKNIDIQLSRLCNQNKLVKSDSEILNNIFNEFKIKMNDEIIFNLLNKLNPKDKNVASIANNYYAAAFGMINSFAINLESEIVFHYNYLKSDIKLKDYFNIQKQINIIDNYFSIISTFITLLKIKNIKKIHKVDSSEFKKLELFPDIKKILKKNNCTLRKALVLLENKAPGTLKKAGEILKINYRQLSKDVILIANSRKRVRKPKSFSDNNDIEIESRILSKKIKSDFSRFNKPFQS